MNEERLNDRLRGLKSSDRERLLLAELVLLRDAHRMACREVAMWRKYIPPLRANEMPSTDEAEVDDVVAEFLGKASGSAPEDDHEHEWVDASNEAVQSGEMCVKCHAIRPAPEDEAAA